MMNVNKLLHLPKLVGGLSCHKAVLLSRLVLWLKLRGFLILKSVTPFTEKRLSQKLRNVYIAAYQTADQDADCQFNGSQLSCFQDNDGFWEKVCNVLFLLNFLNQKEPLSQIHLSPSASVRPINQKGRLSWKISNFDCAEFVQSLTGDNGCLRWRFWESKESESSKNKA